MEDPIFMCMMARAMVDKKEEEGTRKSLKDRQLSMMGAVNRLLEVRTQYLQYFSHFMNS